MTSAAPGPGWLVDPDDAQLERYWSGATWTDYRRRYQPAVESSNGVVADDVEPERAPWVANASFAPPVVARAEPRIPAPPPVVGESASVVAGDHRVGQVGTVVDVSEGGCLLKFSDDRHGFRFFGFDELEAVAAPRGNSASAVRSPGWYAEGSNRERWWRWNRALLVMGLLILVGGAVAAFMHAKSSTRDGASYRAGQALHAESQEMFFEACPDVARCQGSTPPITLDGVCRRDVEKYYGANPSFTIDDVVAGCVDGFESP